MGQKLITGPVREPLALAEVKTHCRVTIDDDDGLLAGLMLAAREWCESFTGRLFITQTWEYSLLQFSGCGIDLSAAIELPHAPVQSITFLTYVDYAGVTNTLDPAEYQLSLDSTVPRIAPAWAKVWPVARKQFNSITVRYVAGYGSNPGDVPNPIRQAMLMLISYWYDNRDSAGLANLTEAPFTTCALLQPFKVYGFA